MFVLSPEVLPPGGLRTWRRSSPSCLVVGLGIPLLAADESLFEPHPILLRMQRPPVGTLAGAEGQAGREWAC